MNGQYGAEMKKGGLKSPPFFKIQKRKPKEKRCTSGRMSYAE